MDKFFRTYWLPITVRIVEENSLVNLFSAKVFSKSLFFRKNETQSQDCFLQKKKSGRSLRPQRTSVRKTEFEVVRGEL